MNAAGLAVLPDRALARVSGEEAEKFLQALITCDIDHLAPGEANFGALLTPQGKILFDFFVVRTGDGFLLDVAGDKRDELIQRLNFYKLRAKVEIAAEDGLKVMAAWGDHATMPEGIAVADPRLAELGRRIYSGTAPEDAGGDYAGHRIGLGMPEGGKDYDFGDCFPHEALMDQFGGVDFVKGCYVGQEVVSRMQHRGTARRRVVMVEGDGSLPPAGTTIDAGGKPAGTMGSSVGGSSVGGSPAGNAGLAMLRLDRVREALDAGGEVTAAGKVLSVKLQPWVSFGWPES